MKKNETIIALSILNILTIFGAFLILNRLGGTPFNFTGRIFIEHFFTGFYTPLLILFFTILLIKGYSYLFTKNKIAVNKQLKYSLLIIFSLTIVLFEFWWQFGFLIIQIQYLRWHIYLLELPLRLP